MANQDNKDFVGAIVDANKQAMETLVENTKKFTNGNNLVNETMQKGSEWYKNWLENQKTIFTQATSKAEDTAETVKENGSKMNEFYQNWYNTQTNWAKQMWEMNLNTVKNHTNNTDHNNTNPMNQWNNMMTNWTNWMSNMQHGNNAMNIFSNMQNMNPFAQMQNNNPFSMDGFKKGNETFTNIFNQYTELMNGTFAEMQKGFRNTNVEDAYRNMVNVTDGFVRFYEMWTPMWKSVQDKSFNMDMYKKWANPEMYKEMMDKYFGFMPENARQYMSSMHDMMNNGMKQQNAMGMNQFQQMRDMMANMPGMNGGEMFGNMLNGYNQLHTMMTNAVSPITKMMTPNEHTRKIAEWSDIANRMMVYNIKNAELQYMIYKQGTKVMDSLAQNVATKVQNGEEINSMMSLYQEWLNISDKVFVSLFESDEYSQLMAEVSAMQMTLRKDTEGQMEKMLVNIPVATRSEMDEMYKTIYDLKKQVRELEKTLEHHTATAAAANHTATTGNGTPATNGTANPSAKVTTTPVAEETAKATAAKKK